MMLKFRIRFFISLILVLSTIVGCNFKSIIKSHKDSKIFDKEICLFLEMKNNQEKLLKEEFLKLFNKNSTSNYGECDYLMIVFPSSTVNNVPDFSGAILQSQVSLYVSYAFFKKDNKVNSLLVDDFFRNKKVFGKSKDIGAQFTGIGSTRLRDNLDNMIENSRIVDKFEQYKIQLSSLMKDITYDNGNSVYSVVFSINPYLLSATHQAEVDTIESLYTKVGSILYEKAVIFIEKDLNNELLPSDKNSENNKNERSE